MQKWWTSCLEILLLNAFLLPYELIFFYCTGPVMCRTILEWCSLLLLENTSVWVGMLEVFWKHMSSTLSKRDLHSSLGYKYPTGQLTEFSSSTLLKDLRYCRGRKYEKEYLLLRYFNLPFSFLCLLIYHRRIEYIVFWRRGTKVYFSANILITLIFIILIPVALPLLVEK